MLDQVLETLGVDTVVAVMYHMNWPSPANDPWYFNNTTENNARRTYYNVNAIPWGFFDGNIYITSYSSTYLTNNIVSRYSISSPYETDISCDPSTASISVKVKATDTPPAGSKYLRIAVVEKEYVASSPFPNGTRRHTMSMLDMVPDALGVPINIAIGDSQTFTFNYDTSLVNMHPLQSLENLLTVVAFVQNDQNKGVLQAAYGEAGIKIGTINSSLLLQPSSNGTLEGFAYNKSNGPIELDLSISGQIPSGWILSSSCSQGNIPINSGALTVNLAAQDSIRYTIDVDPQNNTGSVILEGNVSLTGNPSLSTSSRFYLSTNDVNALVVNSSDNSYGDFVLNSLSRVYNNTYGIISRTALHHGGIDLSNFNFIVWSAANGLPAFYPEEITLLQNYLDNGGNLFITGQDIGYDVFGAGGQSQFAQSFYNNYFHANYVNNSSLFFLVNGYTGDPITNGLSFIIANLYSRSPDIISAYDAQAIPILKYMTGPNVAGIAAVGADYKVVYLGIGFEQITDEPDRDSILVRSIRWFNEGPSGLNDNPELARSFRLQPNYPNPFNPETIIQYSLDNLTAEATQLWIYNSLGQLTRQLVNEDQPVGSYQVTWDGKDNSGKPAASGVYYYQLISGNNKAVQKMILLR